MLSHSAAPRIVVLKENRLHAELICQQIQSLWRNSEVRVFQRGLDAVVSIQARRPDLFITGVDVEDMDGLQHLKPFIECDLPILVVTARKDARIFHLLRTLRYDGIFDAGADRGANLQLAIEDVMEHQLYISSSMVPHIWGGWTESSHESKS
jgi:DNA-binding NarL/FixJ family response regulator